MRFVFKLEKQKRLTHHLLKNFADKLSVVHRTIRTTITLTIAFACICRFKLSFLTRRDKMLMLFIILDDLFRHHLAFKTPQSILDRFVTVYSYISHSLSPPSAQKFMPRRANYY